MDKPADKSPQEIERQLWKDLEDAQSEYLHSVTGQNAVIAELPSGIPAADGNLRIEQTRRIRKAAFQRYKDATQALNEFSKGLAKEP